MRVHKIVCSHCKTGLTSKAGIEAGTVIPCPKCKKKFKVDAADDDEVIEDFEVVDGEEDEEEEETPKKKPTPKPAAPAPNAFSKLGGEEKPKKKRRDDDEDDDRPRKKKKKKKKKSAYAELKENIWVRAAVLIVLLGGLAGAAYWRWGITRSPETIYTDKPADEDDDLGKPIVPDPNKGKAPKKKTDISTNTIPDLNKQILGSWAHTSMSSKYSEISITLEYQAETFNQVVTLKNDSGTQTMELGGNWTYLRKGTTNNSIVIRRPKNDAMELEDITIVFANPMQIRQEFAIDGNKVTFLLNRK